MDTADKNENTRRAEHGSEREGARDTRASETEIGDRERRSGGSGGSGGTSERTATRVVGEGQRNVRDTFSRHSRGRFVSFRGRIHDATPANVSARVKGG